MKQIGDRIQWNGVNKFHEGTIEKIRVTYTVRTDEGKYVLVTKDIENENQNQETL